MATKDRAVDRGTRRAVKAVRELGGELREARIGAGLSQAAVAAALGVSQSWVSRTENGEHPNLSIRDASRFASVVGLDLSVRVFAGGPPLRDAAHVALLQRLRTRTSVSILWRLEAPLPVEGDQRAYAALIWRAADRAGIEAEVRVRDAQSVLRRVQLKQRDGGLAVMILLVARTQANRAAVHAAGWDLRGVFPLSTREVLRELGAGRIPKANGLVLL